MDDMLRAMADCDDDIVTTIARSMDGMYHAVHRVIDACGQSTIADIDTYGSLDDAVRAYPNARIAIGVRTRHDHDEYDGD